ncbi:helix-turn-helix transcriptional regulator [Nocardia asiatica]|uniref:helix-turn-helix transcriptional regulator n=1 Tax=Nocardia asiatica TaxID=209252 RepID=UPI0002D98E89|nr:helix-turn-helix domain-containing protein [Nocardia asiatica]
MQWTGKQVRALRSAYGMTQCEFAERAGVAERTIGYWEQRGTAARLSARSADLMETLLDWLSPDARRHFDRAVEVAAPVGSDILPATVGAAEAALIDDVLALVDKHRARLSQPMPSGLHWMQKLLIPDEGMDVHRRELLRLLGVIAGAVGTEPLLTTLAGADDAKLALPASTHVDDHILDLVETAISSTLRLDDALGPQAALDTAAAQYRLTGALLSGCAEWFRPRLLSLRSNLARLLAWLNFNLGRYDLAQHAYQQALDAAHEAEDAALSAITLCQMSHLATWSGAPRAGVDRGVAAQAWAREAGDARLRAYAADVTARAFAAAGQQQPCLEALELIGGLTTTEPGSPATSHAYFYDQALATSTRGLCMLDLGETAAAAAAFEDSLAGIDHSFTRNLAFNSAYLARARLAEGDVDEAARVAGSAVALAAENPSPRLVTVLHDVHTSMRPWASRPAVRDLGEQFDSYLVSART